MHVLNCDHLNVNHFLAKIMSALKPQQCICRLWCSNNRFAAVMLAHMLARYGRVACPNQWTEVGQASACCDDEN